MASASDRRPPVRSGDAGLRAVEAPIQVAYSGLDIWRRPFQGRW